MKPNIDFCRGLLSLLRASGRSGPRIARGALLLGAAALAGCAAGEEPADSGDDEQVAEDPKALFPHTARLWPSGTIPVCWDDFDPGFAAERQEVQDAAENTWDRASGVDFVGWGACNGGGTGIRIQVADEGPHTTGLGTDIAGDAGGMVLNFTFANWGTACQPATERMSCIRTIAVHEFGHALGFSHEQNRFDTPSTCTEPAQGTDGNLVFGEWDLDSVMNYCNPEWSGNGELSVTDTIGVQTFYGPAEPCHRIAEEGNRLGFICDPLVAQVCATTPSCCDVTWDAACVAAAATVAGEPLGCAHDKEVTGARLLSSCDPCVAQVCAADSYCCTTSWDGICVNEVNSVCGCPHDKLVTGAKLAPACQPCVAEICAVDSYCCTTNWDGICVNEVSSVCGAAREDLLLYRPGGSTSMVARSNGDGSFSSVMFSTAGFASYDLVSSNDSALVLDYNNDKKKDAFFFRPGTGAAMVARGNGDGSYSSVYLVGDNGAALPNGIAGFDLLALNDRAFVFDYNGDGRDDLFFYRPGTGAVTVARSNGDGSFTAVYAVGDDGPAAPNGIAGYDLFWATDRVVPLDYNGDGRDDLLLYRPGNGLAMVARSNGDGSFTAVYYWPAGIGGYDLMSLNDEVVVFDYDGDHKDDLAFYRPGSGAITIAHSNGDGIYWAAYNVPDNGAASPNGIGTFPLLSPTDRILAFDYNGDHRDDLFLYSPGTGGAAVIKSNGDGTFQARYAVDSLFQWGPSGIAGHDLLSSADRVGRIDYNGDGRDDLVLYRPGSGSITVARSAGDGSFSAVHVTPDNGTALPNGIAGYDLLSWTDRLLVTDINGTTP